MMECDYWLGFSVFSGIGPIKFKKLLAQFGSAKDAWHAPGSHLAKLIGEKLAVKFDESRNKFSIEGYVDKLKKNSVSFITLTENNYPELLKKIKNPPFVLYVKGDPSSLRSSGPSVAVVGTRRATQYGREVTKILTEELVAAGFTVVSGLAIGVDAISHKTAIENSGKTIAVLGCGVDCCYPLANQSIYNSIVYGNGCVVSEYPLGLRPTKGSFPARNRIIAGLSMGVLVTEGAEDSGSLITADYAIKFGRKVFAVPGPITSSMSKGPYKLIQKGAKLVTKAEDILREFKIQNSKVKSASQKLKVNGATKEEQEILNLLQNEPLHFDEIVRKTGLQSSIVGSMLSVMEMKGMVKSLEGGMFGL